MSVRAWPPASATAPAACMAPIRGAAIPCTSTCPHRAKSERAMSDLRVLVVDDEPLAIERLQILLARQEGVSLVGTAGDGEAALRVVDAVRPDRVARAIERAREHPRRGGAPAAPAPRYVQEFWVPELHGLVRIGADQIER